MEVLVTGATGFVGRHVAHALARRGHAVRCLVRDSADPAALLREGFAVVRGALLDQRSLEAAVTGADAVVHVAGLISARSFTEMRSVNAEGVGRLAAACVRTARPPGRFVLVSSLAAGGPSSRGGAVREEDEPRPVSRYGLTKLLGERTARRVLADRVALTVIRPPAVYGPFDRGLLAFFQAASHGILLRLGTRARQVSIVHGEDLADAIARALVCEAAAGRTYYVADPEPHDLDAVLAAIARAVGVRTRSLLVPEPFVRIAGALAEEAARLRGERPLFSRDKAAEFLAPGWVCDSSRARRELAWAPARSLAQGLQETARWYREHHWLTAAASDAHVVA